MNIKPADVIFAGIAGTSTFTLFSYIMAETSGKPYKQPELLGQLINRSDVDLNRKQSQFAGWLTHYLIGIGFAAAYQILVNEANIQPSLKNGAIVGAVSAVPAALSWDTGLKLHPSPPRKRTWDYYVELVAGHVIFGATCFWVFQKRKDRKKSSIVKKSFGY